MCETPYTSAQRRPKYIKKTAFHYISNNFASGSHFVTRGQFWHSGIVIVCVCVCVFVCLSVCLSVCQSRACPHDNLGPVQARITKFGLKMQKTLVKVL